MVLIQIFLPDYNGQKEGDFYQDGAVQWRGFERAKVDGASIDHALDVTYNPMDQNETPEVLFQRMKKRYDEGSRYFIMTMSSKVENILGRFKNWHDDCKRTDKKNGAKNAPILIVTVASAPV